MLIAIPSKGRPDKVTSTGILKDATLFVPEVEVRDYAAFGHRNVVGVPNHIRGITATRNWILKACEEPWCVFVDDDVASCGWVELHRHDKTCHQMRKQQWWMDQFRRLCEVTEDLGYRLWGISTLQDPRAVYPWRPFLWHTYVTASCCGVKVDGNTWFDESFPVKEDYELCLRCIKEDGGIVGARYLYWQNLHWTTEGGCKDYRTQEMEEDCISRLMTMYPGMIRQVTKGGSNFSIKLDF